MTRYDLFELALRNVKNSRLRNALTTMGIAVGVASLVATLALGVGLQQFASSRLQRSGLFETIFVTSKSDWRNADREKEQEQEDPSQAPLLDDAARTNIAKLANVAEVQPEIRAMAEVEFGEKSHMSFVAGLPPSAREDESFEKLQGAFFSAPGADEAIIQSEFAKRLSPDPTKLIGQELTLRYAERQSANDGEQASFSITRNEKKLKIVGVLEEEPFGGMRMVSRARVFIPTATAERMNLMQYSDTQQVMRAAPGTRVYTMLTVRTTNISHTDQLQNEIKKLGFGTYSFLDATKSMRKFFAVVDIFLGIFGSLALAVASLAIVNTLVMAVMERRREIGIMKALGASDGDVKRIFFSEAAAMGAAGGLLGVFLGWLIGKAINLGANVYLSRNNMPGETIWTLPLWLVVGAIAFSILVSILSGIYPAARAAKLDPVQALRYE